MPRSTIVNCFAKAGFQQHQLNDHYDEEDELPLSIYADMSSCVTNCADIDNNLSTEDNSLDLNLKKLTIENDVVESDEETTDAEPDQNISSYRELFQLIKQLKTFAKNKNDFRGYSLSTELEEHFEAEYLKTKNAWLKQASITNRITREFALHSGPNNEDIKLVERNENTLTSLYTRLKANDSPDLRSGLSTTEEGRKKSSGSGARCGSGNRCDNLQCLAASFVERSTKSYVHNNKRSDVEGEQNSQGIQYMLTECNEGPEEMYQDEQMLTNLQENSQINHQQK
ncbi:hypothetical protein ABEB36_003096 [Hypothenemus hampei]|uniref:Uncharacterized protein n=1 Tax=Hypothenemus hampei TaxID=57062 RepID=A0ABD1F9V6_HYPHA